MCAHYTGRMEGGLTVVSMIIFAHHVWLPITLFLRPFYLKYVSHSAGGYSIMLCELADQSDRREHAILSVWNYLPPPPPHISPPHPTWQPIITHRTGRGVSSCLTHWKPNVTRMWSNRPLVDLPSAPLHYIIIKSIHENYQITLQ